MCSTNEGHNLELLPDALLFEVLLELLALQPVLQASTRLRASALTPTHPVWRALDLAAVVAHSAGTWLSTHQSAGCGVQDPRVRLPRVAGRCCHLRSINLQAITFSRDEFIQLLGRNSFLRSVQLNPAEAWTANCLPLLRSSVCTAHLRSLSLEGSSINASAIDQLPAAVFGHLQQLSLAGCDELLLSASESTWGCLGAAAPALRELTACFRKETFSGVPANWSSDQLDPTTAVQVVRKAVVALKAVRPQLRINTLSAQSPKPLSVSCGICGVVLWGKLESYIIAPPSQNHIESEVYTDVRPENIKAYPEPVVNETRKWHCAHGCHGNLWLVDRGSGYVDRMEYEWAIAVGPATVDHPTLGQFCMIEQDEC